MFGRTSYSISWLYGEFRIARLHRDTIEAEWEAPELVETQAQLVRALDAACRNIDLTAKGDVSVVHEHDLHTHDYLEVPSMKRRDLEKYLQRRVEFDKSFEDDASWCYHRVSHRGGKEGVLLHLLPKKLVDDTTAALTAAGLAPKKYVPLTEIVSDYLPTTDVAPEALVVVVACFKERTEIILALGDGEALFVRELNYGQSESSLERLVTDINRTVRYTRQQLGRGVDTVWAMGQFNEEVNAHLDEMIEVPVRFDSHAGDPYFWARSAVHLSGKLSANFISVFEQKNITKDVLKRVGVWTTAATIAASVVFTLFTTGLVAHRADEIIRVNERAGEMRVKIDGVNEFIAQGETREQHLERLRAATHNLPSLVMVHLSRLTPPDVTLTDVEIKQAGDAWAVSLKGQVVGDMRHGARVLARFEERLARKPWAMVIERSFTETWMEQFSQGRLGADGLLGFDITGRIR